MISFWPSHYQLFVDKDTIVNAVGASHDIHLLKIDNREDELVTGINSWCTQLVDKVSKYQPFLAGWANLSSHQQERT
jgi:hypothetical protein